MILPAHRLALAVGEQHEARLLALVEDTAFQVAGRGCAVTGFCSTIRELREALGRTDSIDAVVMSSTLQAVPPATLRELVQIGRPLVVLVPDPTAAHWAEVPAPVPRPGHRRRCPGRGAGGCSARAPLRSRPRHDLVVESAQP